MEHKIGEIFEYKGEWYQCVNGECKDCDFSKDTFYCKCLIERDFCKARSIFKKLEKVREPYVGNNGTFQSYKLAMPIYGDIPDQIIGFTTTEVVIKQNKEDMEEGELDPCMAKVIDEATQKQKETYENTSKLQIDKLNEEIKYLNDRIAEFKKSKNERIAELVAQIDEAEAKLSDLGVKKKSWFNKLFK